MILSIYLQNTDNSNIHDNGSTNSPINIAPFFRPRFDPYYEPQKITKSRELPYSNYGLSLYKRNINADERSSPGEMNTKDQIRDAFDFFNPSNLDSDDEYSSPFTFTKQLQTPLKSSNPPTRQLSFTSRMVDVPDFPYWNLLRQKWLITEPRRLSQVRLLGKRYRPLTSSNGANKRPLFLPRLDANKSSLIYYLYLRKLLSRP